MCFIIIQPRNKVYINTGSLKVPYWQQAEDRFAKTVFVTEPIWAV